MMENVISKYVLIYHFNQKYPDIRVKIMVSSNFKLIDRISNGHMELGIANHMVQEAGLTSNMNCSPIVRHD
jgi:DNA-binding transcriptional LysR family regulator